MNEHPTRRTGQRIAAAIATLFGIVTLFAGSRVLLGFDPGYVVFRPLLLYNTAMGIAYLTTGVLIWRRLAWGRFGAGAIFFLNLVVLAGIIAVFRSGGAVAVESLRAMSFRTIVWLALYLATTRLDRRRAPA
ncbi:MAG: hypothetical protein B6D46_06070 [Polyangiaceae bacterium UTPRO1]|nr:hypothetical protein [Myxococcales bacterium]OQY67590.1 MAG: hypothetical protein B6D46_06070 [Polyangiaceae bacterium UTPRO1]